MRLTGLILFIMLACFSVDAQIYLKIVEENADLPFNKIVQEVESYYQGKDKGRGSGYKQFKRWEFFHADRLDENGYLQNVARRELDEFVSYRSFKALPKELNFACNWEEVGGAAYERISSGHNGGMGRVNTILVDPDDPNILYAGTPAGGLWRSTSNGGWNPGNPSSSFWQPLTDGLPYLGVSGIVIDPSSPAGNRTIYILTGDGDGRNTRSIGVLKSFDGGDTWFETDLSWGISDQVYGYKLIMDPTDPEILFAATTAGIYRTTDGGVNWSLVQGGSFRDIEFRPTTPDIMYATTSSQFFKSIDSGATWDPIPGAGCQITNAGVRLEIGVTPADPNMVYVISGGLPTDMSGALILGQFNGLYQSTNSGDCFTLRSNQPNVLGYPDNGIDSAHQSGYDLAIAVSPIDANEVHVAGINCWRSLDGGASWGGSSTSTWSETAAAPGDYTHADVHFLGFFGNSLYSGSDGGVAVTTNNADDWSFISQGLRITQFYRISAFSDGDDYAMGGAQDNGLNQLVDAGAGFGNIQHWEGADGFEISPDPDNNQVFGATQNGCLNRFDYPNGGVTGLTVFPGDSCGGAWLTPHIFDDVNDAVLAGYQDLWRSTDSGNNWTNISNGNIGGDVARHLVMAPSDDDVIYISKPTVIYRTIDGGTSWANITSDLPAVVDVSSITYYAVDPADPDRIWVTLSGFTDNAKVYFRDVGTDAGWTNITGSLPNLPANCIAYEAGSVDGLYIGMDVGVYYRDNNLGDWVLFSNGLPNVIVRELEINPTTNKIYAGTYGRGMWCSNLISNCADICLNCPVFENFHSSPNTYSSEDCIISSAVVFDDTDITYEAENYVYLEENFYVKTGEDATFHAIIEECSPVAPEALTAANLRELSGFYVGKLPLQNNIEVDTRNFADITAPSIKAFPNPVKQQLNVEFQIPEKSALTVRLYNITGNLVSTFENGKIVDAGWFSSAYDMGNLPDGTYILEAIAGQERFQIPVIKTRQ